MNTTQQENIMTERKLKNDRYEIFGKYDSYTLEELTTRLKEVHSCVIEHMNAVPDSVRFSIEEIYHDYEPDPSIQFCATFKRPETDKEHFDRIEQENRNKKYQEERDRKEYERLQKQFGNQ